MYKFKLMLISFFSILFISSPLVQATEAESINDSPNASLNPGHTHVVFQDNFNNNQLNTNKWDFFDNGGNISFSKGNITLSAGIAMPFIRAKNNPIPVTGPFTVEFGIKYLIQAEGGDGVAISFSQQANVADASTWPNNPLALWQDSVGFRIVSYGSNALTISSSDFNYHIVKISYDGAKYTVSIDSSNVYTSPNTARVGGLWFGHPNYCCPSGGWSSFKLNYIKVTQP